MVDGNGAANYSGDSHETAIIEHVLCADPSQFLPKCPAVTL